MRSIALSVLCLASLSNPVGIASAQDTHSRHHGTQKETGRLVPMEPGQSAFAVVAEIVALLGNDPDTEWDRVNIDKLRTHLADMSELWLNAEVETIEEKEAVIFRVTGQPRTIEAIRRMVPAHANVLRTEMGWDASAEVTGSAVQLRISAGHPDELAIFRGLGFFGVMATGAHHQAHHLAIARGEMIH